MNSKEIARFIGRRPWLRRIGYRFIFLTTLREWYIARALRRLLAVDPDIRSALDAGCGMGQHTYALSKRRPGLRITAMEQDPEQSADLADFFQRSGIKEVAVRSGDITCADLGEPVDLVLCCSVLEHIEDDLGLLRRFHDHLRENGSLLIYVPLAERRVLKSLERRIAAMTQTTGDHLPHGHIRYYTPEWLEARLRQCGFSVFHRELSYGPKGRLAYDLVTRVQFSRFFLVLFPFYLVLLHPLVMVLMAIDYFGTQREGNGLLLVARKLQVLPNLSDQNAATLN
ncbi:MAG TPA: class I SAM-dependent methyltransferase [bacterium]|nr:class I SAM-dependent methyltransferase [bacterium]HQG45902.1 class I SAM-dependent methyltransferase [bacterium]HQI47816.1 class I SAM-dependent methyltransferase [bacterium]HQJ64020.1 class I SAM-dependent methyltransferase [bacterium]